MRNGTDGEYGKFGNAKPATYRPDWPIARSNPTLTASCPPLEHQFMPAFVKPFWKRVGDRVPEWAVEGCLESCFGLIILAVLLLMGVVRVIARFR